MHLIPNKIKKKSILFANVDLVQFIIIFFSLLAPMFLYAFIHPFFVIPLHIVVFLLSLYLGLGSKNNKGFKKYNEWLNFLGRGKKKIKGIVEVGYDEVNDYVQEKYTKNKK